MVIALWSSGLPGDKLPQSVTMGRCRSWAFHHTLQMGAPLYRSPPGDITSLGRTELMMKANISFPTRIYQINFIFTDPSAGLLAYWRFADGREGERAASEGWWTGARGRRGGRVRRAQWRLPYLMQGDVITEYPFWIMWYFIINSLQLIYLMERVMAPCQDGN